MRTTTSAFLCALALVGCASRKPALQSWRLEKSVVLPPRAGAPEAPFQLRHARSVKRNLPACQLRSREVELRWKGTTALVRADARPLAPVPGGLVMGSAGGGAPAGLGGDVLVRSNWYRDEFLPNLASQTAAGCLSLKDAPLLRQRLIDNLPLPSGAAYRMRYGEYPMDGYLDLDAKFRLRAVEPIREQGQVVGFKTSFYPLVPTPDGGVRATAGDSETNLKAVITHGQATDSEVLHMPPHATWVRLFLRTWSETQDRRIALIAAASPRELDLASKAFEANPEGFCARAGAMNAACVGVPKDMVIGPELRVRVNGTDQYAPVGGHIADVLRTMNIRNGPELVKSMKVSRPYEGRLVSLEFDRTSNDILSLVLLGGEEITW